MINANTVHEATGAKVKDFKVDGLGVASCREVESLLTFVADGKYVTEANENSYVKALFTTHELSEKFRKDVVCLVVDDPKWYFFKLVNYLAKNRQRLKSFISERAVIHSSAVIAEQGVVIEDDVIVEPNVTIMSDVLVSKGAIIRAGAVLGVDGYEHKKTEKGILSVAHNGSVVIGERVEVGVNCNIAKGFSYRNTVIGADSKLDALVHYAHGVQCGERCMIVACAMLAGHVTLGDDVWVGPKATVSNRITIGNGAFITLGSVVVKDVAAGEKVTGNFAVPHIKFLRNLKKINE